MNELTNVVKAKELDRKIKISAQLAQQSLYEMCVSIKEMRDTKLYKELGYQSFEDYCEQEVGIKRRSAYNFIKILDTYGENVQTFAQIGSSKLLLLSGLSEEEREEIIENTDVENTSVRELKTEIENLRADKAKTESENQALEDKILRLEKEIKELESRPIEVAVQPSADEERLRETIRSLERENIRQNEEMDKRNHEQMIAMRERFAQEKEKDLASLREELAEAKEQLEKAKAQPAAPPPEDKEKQEFKVLLTNAADSLNRLLGFIGTHDNDIYKQKAAQLSSLITSKIGG